MLAIFVVESKSKKYDSDYKYIKEFIREHYSIDCNTVLRAVYLNGKSNYNQKEKEINKLKDMYKCSGREDETVVVFLCTDIDDIKNKETAVYNVELNEKIRNYCDKNGFEYVWFYRDIEETFLGKRQTDKIKVKCADDFVKKNAIQKIDINRLNVKSYVQHKYGCSNIKVVTDKYFLIN